MKGFLVKVLRKIFGARYADVAPRLDAIEVRLDALELNVGAIHQQMDECIAFLQVQHEVTRDTLELLKAERTDQPG